MTKMKSKKMTKSTFAIIIMAIVMVALLAFGGTYAFFTAQATGKTDDAKTGRVQLSADATFTLVETVVPGQQLLTNGASISVTPNSSVKTFVFVKFDVAFAKDATPDVTFVQGTPAKVATKADIDQEGEYCLTTNVDVYDAQDNADGVWKTITVERNVIYYQVVEANATTKLDVCSSIIFEGKSESLNGAKGTLMDGTVTVTFDSSSIQYAGFETKAEVSTSTYETEAAAALAAYTAAGMKA